jgi:hypothetical protein
LSGKGALLKLGPRKLWVLKISESFKRSQLLCFGTSGKFIEYLSAIGQTPPDRLHNVKVSTHFKGSALRR